MGLPLTGAQLVLHTAEKVSLDEGQSGKLEQKYLQLPCHELLECHLGPLQEAWAGSSSHLCLTTSAVGYNTVIQVYSVLAPCMYLIFQTSHKRASVRSGHSHTPLYAAES